MGGGIGLSDSQFLIVDGSSVLVRAYFATAYPGRTPRQSNGIYTNAVMGFLNMLLAALQRFRPSHLFIAWDVSRDTFRKTLYPNYKGTRGELPDELLAQFETMQEVLAALGIAQSLHPDYEADDIIGTLAIRGQEAGLSVVILTGDRDALQLSRANITIAIMKRGLSELEFYTPDALNDAYGLAPEQMIDVKSLMGDTSDNIPGVPGIGEKTAIKLVREFGSLEYLLEVGRLSLTGKLRERLNDYADQARLSKTLATIVLDVPVPHTVPDCLLALNLAEGGDKLRSLNLGRSVEQLGKLAEAL